MKDPSLLHLDNYSRNRLVHVVPDPAETENRR